MQAVGVSGLVDPLKYIPDRFFLIAFADGILSFSIASRGRK
jgi:hypothetical protein